MLPHDGQCSFQPSTTDPLQHMAEPFSEADGTSNLMRSRKCQAERGGNRKEITGNLKVRRVYFVREEAHS